MPSFDHRWQLRVATPIPPFAPYVGASSLCIDETVPALLTATTPKVSNLSTVLVHLAQSFLHSLTFSRVRTGRWYLLGLCGKLDRVRRADQPVGLDIPLDQFSAPLWLVTTARGTR